jgi:hypothetical protein
MKQGISMRRSYLIGLLAVAALQIGCSSTRGTFQPNTHFAYPNSNVQPLGHVIGNVKEGSFIIPPELTKEKALKLISDTLAQKPGADMIVNYRLDTTYTVYPFYSLPLYIVQEIKLEGTAAKMDLGEQNIVPNATESPKRSNDQTAKRKKK